MMLKITETASPPWWRLAILSIGGKKRNKRLLHRLTDFNLALARRDEILSALKLSEADLHFLNVLAGLSDAWHEYKFWPKHDGLKRLAEQGLVLLSWPGKKVRLSDAGRFLLSLAAGKEF